MPDEPTTPESTPTESAIEGEEEFAEDIAERIDATLVALSERVASIEQSLSELLSRLGSHDERFAGLDTRFDSAFGGRSEPDHGPTSDHPWFRKVGNKTYK